MTEAAGGKCASTATRSRVSTNGIELSYVERGTGDPLILIMGLGAGLESWELHVREYEKHFRCFTVDNRGAGESDKPAGPYSTAQMADDYAGLIRALELPKVRVVGISMGGAIAQELAIRHAECVERMVIVSSWARTAGYSSEVFAQLRSSRDILPRQDFARLLQLFIWSPPYVDDHLSELIDSRGEQSAMPAAAFQAQADACLRHDTIGRLTDLRIPTLITVGDRDTFTPIELARELAGEISGAELKVFPGAGHAHHWEMLDDFNSYTARWLA